MTMTRLAASEARREFSQTLLRVLKGERILIQRNGKDLAVLIPVEDHALLEFVEDRVDLEAAKKALAEGGKPVPYENLRRELGLDRGGPPDQVHRGRKPRAARPLSKHPLAGGRLAPRSRRRSKGRRR